MNIKKLRKNIFVLPLLYLVSLLYGLIIELRNFFYDIGFFKTHIFDIAVISIGNISTGGTGKTPFVMYTLEQLQKNYKNIVVVSRGYGRKSKGMHIVSDAEGNIISAEIGGDEPVLIAKKFPNIPVIVSEYRKEAIDLAIEKFNASVIILDDAFQHRSIARDCNIVLVNASQPVNKDHILPLGNLRETAKNLKRADIILITKIENEFDVDEQVNYCKKFKAEIYKSSLKKMKLKKVNPGSDDENKEINIKSCIAFCGIAQPHSFKKSIIENGITIEKLLEFKDHQTYTKKEIKLILNDAIRLKCKDIITTEKDMIKLNLEDFEGFNLHVLQLNWDVKKDENLIKKLRDRIDLKLSIS